VNTDQSRINAGPERLQALAEARQAEIRHALSATFPSPGLITLEIGSGHGHYLTAYAQTHPDQRCLGIDICRDRVGRAQRKKARSHLTNLSFHRCEAADLLQGLPEHLWIGRVFILFPDPWPKRRHHKNRLVSSSFLSTLAARTTPDCELFFRSDHAPYFETVSALIDSHSAWRTDSALAWPFEEPTVFQQRAHHYRSLSARRTVNLRLENIHPDHQEDLDGTG
jgi:tRNA (guanine-N7-)-methyltransferase